MALPLTKRCLNCQKKIDPMRPGFGPVLYCGKRCRWQASFGRKRKRYRQSR
jgi:hypothetical protein